MRLALNNLGREFHFRLVCAVAGAVALLGLCAESRAELSNALQRVPNTTLKMPQAPQGFGFKTQPAFGTLSFSNPVGIRSAPGETNRLFVIEQGGKVFAITNLAEPTKTLFLDLKPKALAGPLSGLFALTFHPGYETNGFFFVGYNVSTQTAAGTGTHYRVSRFSVSPDDANNALASTELPLITQRYSGSGFCDDMLFGPDGYLYIAVADPAMDASGTLQAIDSNLLGGILRIDVDKKAGNLEPNPHPAVTTNYSIPADNPYVGMTNFNGAPVDPSKVRTEFYAIGLRNPWRMSLDPLSGLLYVGDPGTSLFDEVNVITKGGNYGWPYREGTGPGPRASKAPAGLHWINPVFQRATGALIGGVVYRGGKYSELEGSYIFGDWVNGQVTGLRYAGTNLASAQAVTTQGGVVGFGLDPSDGDLLLISREGGRVLRLISGTNTVGTPLPPTLAETGAFSDLRFLTPNPGIVAYDVNVSFWSDNALKRRWFSIPNTNTMTFNRQGNWSFPTGTVFIKHFELELTNGVPSSARRIETRVLVRNDSGVYGVTYRWGDSATNATLVPAEGLDEPFTIIAGGTVRTQVWHYPSRSECLTCHTPLAGYALGFNTAQLNRDFNYEGRTENQIRALSEAGYFNRSVTGIWTLPALAHATNQAVSLDFRVHSYLAANCVQCHQPGGSARANFDARLSTPFSDSGLIGGAPVNSLDDPANLVVKPGSVEHSILYSRIANPGPNHMPPLGTSVLDQEAIDLLSAWITGSVTNYQSYADWQKSVFGSTDIIGSAPTDDPDVDGASNELEYLTGTDPLSIEDTWRIWVRAADGSAQIRFPRLAHRGFEVQWTSDLASPGSWQPLDVPGNAPIFAATNSVADVQDILAPGTSRFYRVRVFEP